MVHEPVAGIVPPTSLTTPLPMTAVATPPQVLARPLGVATTTPLGTPPVGKLSVKAAPFRTKALELLSVMVNCEMPPATMELGLKDLPTSGGLTATFNVALAAVVFDPPLMVVTAPIGMLLVCAPGVELVTLT